MKQRVGGRGGHEPFLVFSLKPEVCGPAEKRLGGFMNFAIFLHLKAGPRVSSSEARRRGGHEPFLVFSLKPEVCGPAEKRLGGFMNFALSTFKGWASRF
jgi:hypothetical protein